MAPTVRVVLLERRMARCSLRPLASAQAAALEAYTFRVMGLSAAQTAALSAALRELGLDLAAIDPGSPEAASAEGTSGLFTCTRPQLERATARLRQLEERQALPEAAALGEIGRGLERAVATAQAPLSPLSLEPRAVWDWSRTYVAGIINVTPDSFSDGGRFMAHDAAIAHGVQLVNQGADLLDIGGESTRAGANPVAAAEEQGRILPVVRALAGKVSVPLSIDTYHAATAKAAVAAGCSIVNDVSGLMLDPAMGEVVAASKAAVILGHLRGTPRTMMDRVQFHDVVQEVIDELGQAIERALKAGIARERIIVGPGLGFGKHPEHSMELVMRAGEIRMQLGCPVMVGPSRKSFIGAVTGAPVENRLAGTLAAVTAAVLAGAHAVRVHDVAPAVQAARMTDALRARPRG